MAPLGSPVLAIGRSERVERDYWGKAVREHKALGAMRGFIRDYSDMRGSSRCFNSCLQFFYRHYLEGTNREEWRPSCCRGRAVCPHCAVTYGLERGLEVSSLFRALLEPGKLLSAAPTVKAFAEVFTLPDWVSAALDGYVEAKDKKLLRRAVKELTEALKGALVAFYGDGVAAKVSWHWWHSSDPLKGPHWHAHVMVPNISVTPIADPPPTPALSHAHVMVPNISITPLGGGEASMIQSRGVLSPDRLKELKVLWADAVFSCKFVRELGGESRPDLVVDYHFLTRNRGKNSISHRARYDYRHPMQDFAAFVDKRGLPSMDDERVEWFLSRCEFLQGVQLVRSVGWLSNPKIKKIGLKRVEPESENWVKDTVHVYQFVRFDEQGAWFNVFDTVLQVDEGTKHVHRSFLKLGGRPELRRYEWVT
jgi:hypothetical protein